MAPGHGADANASANGTGGGGKEERRKQLAALETKVRLRFRSGGMYRRLPGLSLVGTRTWQQQQQLRQQPANSSVLFGAHVGYMYKFSLPAGYVLQEEFIADTLSHATPEEGLPYVSWPLLLWAI